MIVTFDEAIKLGDWELVMLRHMDTVSDEVRCDLADCHEKLKIVHWVRNIEDGRVLKVGRIHGPQLTGCSEDRWAEVTRGITTRAALREAYEKAGTLMKGCSDRRFWPEPFKGLAGKLRMHNRVAALVSGDPSRKEMRTWAGDLRGLEKRLIGGPSFKELADALFGAGFGTRRQREWWLKRSNHALAAKELLAANGMPLAGVFLPAKEAPKTVREGRTVTYIFGDFVDS